MNTWGPRLLFGIFLAFSCLICGMIFSGCSVKKKTMRPGYDPDPMVSYWKGVSFGQTLCK